MKEWLKRSVILVLIVACAAFVMSCMEGIEFPLSGISVTTQPTKTAYAQGETLSLEGLVVTASYANGRSEAISWGDEGLSSSIAHGSTLNTQGTTSTTLSYGGKTTTQSVTVGAAVVSSIAVTTPPTKTTYAQGESLDLSGLVITATYTDNSTSNVNWGAVDLTSSTAQGSVLSNQGTTNITLTYGGKTSTQDVTVGAPIVSLISVTTPPSKTSYAKGETLDLSGLVITATNTDNSTSNVNWGDSGLTSSTAQGSTLDTQGLTSITLTYGGKTTTQEVTVGAAAVSSIAVTTQPTKTTYTQGETLNLTGLMITATYTDNSTSNVNWGDSGLTASPGSGSTLSPYGTQSVTLSFAGKDVSFNITVQPAVSSIVVTTQPTKTAYLARESLDLTGLELQATYTDSSTSIVNWDDSGLMATPAVLTTGGTTTVTVSYGGQNTTVSVTVQAGTEAYPYIATTAAQLERIANHITNNYTYTGTLQMDAIIEVGANIDLDGLAETGTNWIPVGNSGNPFTGQFDGREHTISNMEISVTQNGAGLFGYVSNATIKNVLLSDVNVTGPFYVGGLVGYADGSTGGAATIELCMVTGTISASGYYVGGLVGYAKNYHIASSASAGNVSSSSTTYSKAGGLVGESESSTIQACFATGNVTGASYNIGGLVGTASGSTQITSCYATGDVTGTGSYYINFGGLVGDASGSTVIDSCYATGNVSGQNNVSGMLGKVTGGEVTVKNSFAAMGTLSSGGSGNINRIFAQLQGYTTPLSITLTNNYANSAMTVGGSPRSSSDASSKDGADKTLAELKSVSFFTTAANWTGSATWNLTGTSQVWGLSEGGFPYLRWAGQ